MIMNKTYTNENSGMTLANYGVDSKNVTFVDITNFCKVGHNTYILFDFENFPKYTFESLKLQFGSISIMMIEHTQSKF